ncbi:MAG TPA: HD-GYP domain-containing protein [Solirubrobacteraceae bacterium]|nr:HD-GYP domain-containing protein [Solirubrobacteraceae bacterium]
MNRRERIIAASLVGLLVAAVIGAALSSSRDDWQPLALVLLLAGLAIGSHLFPFETGNVRICGSFMTLVLAMTLLGPAPAVAIAVAAVTVDAVRSRPDRLMLLIELTAFAVFPLAGGLLLSAVDDRIDLNDTGAVYAVAVVLGFMLANVLNFVLVVVPKFWSQGVPLKGVFHTIYYPMLPWNVGAGLFTAVTATTYRLHGVGAIGLLAATLCVFQWLLRSVVQAETRGAELVRRMDQLEAMHAGMLSVMLKTLSLRDPMTARHSAAVARYSRALAEAAGLSDEQQELVHTAGLVHDIGKFIFPDSILQGGRKLSPEEREIIKLHPAQGASIIRRVDGFAGVADVVLAHHERIDGEGYPNRIAGDDIPILSRIIAVADTFDVMTARDSYRSPVSADAAIAELRRVSGTQLEGHLVEKFVRLLQQQDLSFGHNDDEDLEAELRSERRLKIPVRQELAAA